MEVQLFILSHIILLAITEHPRLGYAGEFPGFPLLRLGGVSGRYLEIQASAISVQSLFTALGHPEGCESVQIASHFPSTA